MSTYEALTCLLGAVILAAEGQGFYSAFLFPGPGIQTLTRDTGSFPGLRRAPGEENVNPFQYFWLENSMDRGPWQAVIRGVTKSWTR